MTEAHTYTLLQTIKLCVCMYVHVDVCMDVSSGQNVTLTCRAPNNNIIVVKWSRADLGDEYVLLYRDEQFAPEEQHPSFKNRVDLKDRQMKDGDVSLILHNVTVNDAGTYECRMFFTFYLILFQFSAFLCSQFCLVFHCFWFVLLLSGF
uniref:Ig-like domain-containing protein n=1 Tax=Amphilophus citrinellus TaxID=61819 RepID=A0A3Q0S265_AMPCI